MRIMVFEQLNLNRNLFKTYLFSYSMKFNIDFDVIWLTEKISKDTLKKYAISIDLAYISLDDIYGLKIGEFLYYFNPDCMICYYKSNDYEISQLLHTRPIYFTVFPIEETQFINIHHKLITHMLSSINYLTIDMRKQLYCFGNRNILYIRSDLRYIDIFTLDGRMEHIFYKLSDVEVRLKQNFLRIHKSYIINIIYVICVDKTNHTIKLCDGTILPISNPYYKIVIDSLCALK